MVPGYDGSCRELDNQGYYVNGDGMELQYPVSISISFLIFGGCGLNSMSHEEERKILFYNWLSY